LDPEILGAASLVSVFTLAGSLLVLVSGVDVFSVDGGFSSFFELALMPEGDL
jgi:hypothetical protein